MGAKSIRRTILIGLALGACATSRPETRPVRVLFVCAHGTVKSPVAREFMRRMATERGVEIVISSRGIAPEQALSAPLAAALGAEGVDPTREPVRALSLADLEAADIIIVFNRLPAEFGAWPVRDWSDVPSMNADYPAARAVLTPRLGALLDEFEGGAPTTSRR